MQSETRKIAVIRASRGIGAAIVQHFVQKGDRLVSVSRSPAVSGEWIQADISTSEGIKLAVDKIETLFLRLNGFLHFQVL